MSYLWAEIILPKELIYTIQQYISEKTIYIPSSLSGISIRRIIRNIKASEKCGDHEADKQ